ncbi:hypothetical protein CH063_02205 [Colletotrichum higginsianum]|uniref:Uncharacterized protein n=2 Tax=Colletotrichum higginsianum TaxID=80884 RepID=H1VHS7_COLHI|nr:hypothetical protein CH63R_02079 [Colletotrichum higginsianum IMI 349063]OBR13353.1 hypothetical protein CH63R_02079 [Colletotrichum higginsianum IMI 349063]TID01584.1 hypothetical protein CH35J_003589 [Colletotrichum higginsianum]CCF39780.1 hypothetical protein CH063_02205 [Colletotrichum higginsianum]
MSDVDEAFAPRRGRDAQRRSRRAVLLQKERSLAAYDDGFEPPMSPNTPPALLVDYGNVEHHTTWNYIHFMSNNLTSNHEVTNDSGHSAADGHHGNSSTGYSYNNGEYNSAPTTEDGPRNSFKPINAQVAGTGNASLSSGSSSSGGGGGGGSSNANANASINPISSYPTNSFKPINGNVADSGNSNGTTINVPKLKSIKGNVAGNGSGNGSASYTFTAYPKPKEFHAFEPLNARGLLASAIRLSRKDH